MSASSSLAQAQAAFHHGLISQRALSMSSSGVASNADSSQKMSVRIAAHIARELGVQPCSFPRPSAQSQGNPYEDAVRGFLYDTLHITAASSTARFRAIHVGGKRTEDHLAPYVPFRHLDELRRIVEREGDLLSVLGNIYAVSPDVLVVREPLTLDALNASELLVCDGLGTRSPALERNNKFPIVHAVISCKWTLRSDRAQNARSEALNVVRNRKGRTPHIAVVTAEPMPSRIASLALGTGDIDMVYHMGLEPLIRATDEHASPSMKATLDTLVRGNRLRDITDLPLDLML